MLLNALSLDAPSTIHSKCLALFTHGSMKVRSAVWWVPYVSVGFNNLLRVATHLCFSKHIGLFFPDPNLPLGVLELERHPVIARLKEAFREGEQSGDTRFYCVPLCSTVTRSWLHNYVVKCSTSNYCDIHFTSTNCLDISLTLSDALSDT